MQSGAYQNGMFVVGVAKGGVEEGVDSLGRVANHRPVGSDRRPVHHRRRRAGRGPLRSRLVRPLQEDALRLRPVPPTRHVPADRRSEGRGGPAARAMSGVSGGPAEGDDRPPGAPYVAATTSWVGPDELREQARARLPQPIFDYVDSGSDSEATMAANRSARSRRCAPGRGCSPTCRNGRRPPPCSDGLCRFR